MNRTQRREIDRARFAESAEAIAGLADGPFRAARRSGNDPVSLSIVATTVGGFRVRAANAARWLEEHHPHEGRLYRRLIDFVERDTHPKFWASLAPDDVAGATRTSTGRFNPSPEVRRAVRAWARLVRRRNRGYGLPVAYARARVDRAMSASR